MIGKFRTGNHGSECHGSCYECLRDYTNMAYHSLLDWRLASDLLGIISGRNLGSSVQPRQADRLLENWASDFPVDDAQFVPDLDGTGPAVLFEERIWVAAKSPFEAADEATKSPRVATVRAAAAANNRGVPEVVFIDDFLLDRAPAQVTALITGFDGT